MSSRADGGNSSGRSSWLEPLNDTNHLLVLRHVCLEPHRIHFFGNSSAAALFRRLHVPLRIWQSVWPTGPHRPPHYAIEITEHGNTSNAQRPRQLLRARHVHETSFLWVPHKASVVNLFHFFNNMLGPLWLHVVLSGSETVAKRLFLFKLWPMYQNDMLDNVHAKRWPHNTTHPAWFYTLHKLFREVAWPVEDLWADGRALCFRRFVWAQPVISHHYPYQASTSMEQLYRQLRVMTRVRDAIRRVMVVAPLPGATLASTPQQPAVVWISRQTACSRASGGGGVGRCVKNMRNVLQMLRGTGRFGSVRAVEDFTVHVDPHARDMQLRMQIELLRASDILIGMHGAGMAHIAYLGGRCTAVELLDNFYFRNRTNMAIYSAMSRLQGCGYVAADVRDASHTSGGYELAPRHGESLAAAAHAAWNETQTIAHDACCHYHAKSVPGAHCRCPKGRALHVVVKL